MITLGKEGRDKITGFQGIITGRINWLYGCDQYCIVPKAKDSEIKAGEWFDEGRVEVVGDGVDAEEVQTEKPGGLQRDMPNRRI